MRGEGRGRTTCTRPVNFESTSDILSIPSSSSLIMVKITLNSIGSYPDQSLSFSYSIFSFYSFLFIFVFFLIPY